MKSKMILAGALAATLIASANATEIDITLVGSSAFRAITYNRIESLYDSGFTYTVHSSDTAAKSYKTYSGTASNALGTAGTTIIVRCNFVGSIEGLQALQSQAAQYTVDPVTPTGSSTSATNSVFNSSYSADIVLSDVYPGSSVPSIDATSAGFSSGVIGVQPFAMIKAANTDGASVTNITREQLSSLFKNSGSMPASWLGVTGSSGNNPVYLIGRYTMSGTRVTVERVNGNANTTENLYAYTNTASGFVNVGNTGYSSGGTVITAVTNAAYYGASGVVIGYAGNADASNSDGTPKAGLTKLAYNGVPFSLTNVATGSYQLWSYEHMLWLSTLSGTKSTFRSSLYSAITNNTFQTGNSAYYAYNVPLSWMQVYRTTDGGIVKSSTSW
jgi:hypothetical protein